MSLAHSLEVRVRKFSSDFNKIFMNYGAFCGMLFSGAKIAAPHTQDERR